MCQVYNRERDYRNVGISSDLAQKATFRCGTRYLVIQLVSGETLQERVRRDGAVPVEEALAIAEQIAEAQHFGPGGNGQDIWLHDLARGLRIERMQPDGEMLAIQERNRIELSRAGVPSRSRVDQLPGEFVQAN